jgi:hypothetical protein
MNNQIRLTTHVRQLHAEERNIVNISTMLSTATLEKVHVNNTGRFLKWDFTRGLRDESNKDLFISNGTVVSTQNGALQMSNGCVLEYPLNRFFPKRNFMVLAKYVDGGSQGSLTIDLYGLYLTFGYNQVLSKYVMNMSAIYEDGTNQVFDGVDDFDLNPNYNGHNNENEIAFVVDNDVYGELSVFLNGVKIKSQALLDATKNINIDTARHMIISHGHVNGGLFKLNELSLYDVIPDNEGGLDYIRIMASPPSYPTDMLMFTLDPTNIAKLTSYHNTEIVETTVESTIAADTTINGKVAFSGWAKTNVFTYVAHAYTVAFVCEVTVLQNFMAFSTFFQYDAGITTAIGARDYGFIIEHNGLQAYQPENYNKWTLIGAQTGGNYTSPAWDYTNFVNVPLLFYADYTTSLTRFNVYDVVTGAIVHSGQNTSSTLSEPLNLQSQAHILTGQVAKFGDVLFYNKKLDSTEETQLIQYLLNKYA